MPAKGIWSAPGYNTLDITVTGALALVRAGHMPDETRLASVARRHELVSEPCYLSQPVRSDALRSGLLDAGQCPASGAVTVAVQVNGADAFPYARATVALA